jgi:hypothetical protein
MRRRQTAAIPAAARMTLLQWIEFDDGDTTSYAPPACSSQVQALHARIVLDPGDDKTGAPEPLQPPPGLRLPPLG